MGGEWGRMGSDNGERWGVIMETRMQGVLCCNCCLKGNAIDAANVAGNTNGGGCDTNANGIQNNAMRICHISKIVLPRPLQDFHPIGKRRC